MKEKNSKYFEITLRLFIGLGLSLAIFNLFHNRSLWLDEANLALNIVNKSIYELYMPLDMNQVAPIGFLYVEKIFSTIFGSHDWSLRLFPFMMFLLSVPLYILFALKLTNSKSLSLLSCALFTLNPTIIRYSSEVKQYSSDVLVAIMIALCTLTYSNKKNWKGVLLNSIIGAASIWFSNVAIIFLFASGIYLLICNKKFIGYAVIPIFFWLMSFFVYYYLFIHGHPTKDFMIKYWSNANAFWPQNLLSLDFYVFSADKIRMIFGPLLSFGGSWIITLLFFIIGFLSGLKDKKILFFVASPLFVHFLLSYFSLYPFEKRLILYLLPFFIIVIAFGINYIYEYIEKKGIKLSIYFLLLPVLLQARSAYKILPIEIEEIKKSMQYVNQNISLGDNLYLYYGSTAAFRFYEKKHPKIDEISSVVKGTANRKDWNKYIDEIGVIPGTTWLLFSHVFWEVNRDGLNEEKYIIKKLKDSGWKVIDNKKFKGSSAYKVTR